MANELLDGVLIIGGSFLFAGSGMYVVRRFVPRDVLEENHEVAGYMLAIVSTLYAVLLGLMVVNVQTKYEQAAQMAQAEANCLSDIAHLSHIFGPDAAERVRKCVYEYAVTAHDQDWGEVAEGRLKEETIPSYRALWKTITAIQVNSNKESSSYSNLLTAMSQLSDARRFRMIAGVGLSPVLWTVLIVGEILIVWFTHFFFVERTRVQMLMTAFVVLFLSLNVFLIYLFNNPYRKILSSAGTNAGVRFRPEWFEPEPDSNTNTDAPSNAPATVKDK